MIEFVLVDHPAIKPQCCVICSSSTGPLVDTVGERWGDRVYVCKLCVKRCAAVMGFVKGAKADQVDHALTELAAKEKEVAGLTEETKALRSLLGKEKQRVQATQAALEDVQNRERTRAHLAAEIAGAAQQLLTVGEPIFEEVAA